MELVDLLVGFVKLPLKNRFHATKNLLSDAYRMLETCKQHIVSLTRYGHFQSHVFWTDGVIANVFC